MSKTRTISLLLVISLVLLSGCTWLSRKPHGFENDLLAAMQNPAAESVDENQSPQLPLRVDYELSQKPLHDQELLITLEINPVVDLANSAYAVKVPDAMALDEPQGVIGLGSLKARETYTEEVRLTPVREGLYDVEVFFIAEVPGQEKTIKIVKIPISIGPFQKSDQGFR